MKTWLTIGVVEVKHDEVNGNAELIMDIHQHALPHEEEQERNMKMKTWRRIGIVMIAVAVSVTGYHSVSLAQDGTSLEQKITNATTAADHEALAAYYDQEAQAAHKKHEEHLKLKASYEKTPHLASKTSLPGHCGTIAENYNKTAKEYEGLAKLHRDMAKSAK